jgi:hypothetical protein
VDLTFDGVFSSKLERQLQSGVEGIDVSQSSADSVRWVPLFIGSGRMEDLC